MTALAHHSGMHNRAMFAEMSEHEQRFELLADLGAMIAGEVELDDLLATFADRVARALGADRATLWIIDGGTGEIRSRVATLPEVPELRVPAGHGVVGPIGRRDAEDIRIRNRFRAEAAAQHVADHAAHARRRPAIGLDGRRVVVGFDFDRNAVLVVEGDDAGVVFEDRKALGAAAGAH